MTVELGVKQMWGAKEMEALVLAWKTARRGAVFHPGSQDPD